MKKSSTAAVTWRIVLGVIIFAVGLGVGYKLAGANVQAAVGKYTQIRSGQTQYSFISPLLACMSPGKDFFAEFKDLGQKLTEVINRRTRSGDADLAAVYVRDLETGHWTGVNEMEKFVPASLFKVLIMMSLYKQAETEPGLLERKILYTTPTDLEEGAVSNLKPGTSYTVNELIERMIIDSDNNAKDLLAQPAKAEVLSRVLDDLNIVVTNFNQADDSERIISPRQYSLLFRVLYNATFIDKDMSEKALRLLSQTTFNKGLTASLPKQVKVAHKFGSYTEKPQAQELHDCGIVYQEDHAYLVCAMTRGRNQGKLGSVIQEVSAEVYKYIDSLPD